MEILYNTYAVMSTQIIVLMYVRIKSGEVKESKF